MEDKTLRDSSRGLLNEIRALDSDRGDDLRALIEKASEVVVLAEASVGSCERGVPFADMFIVATPQNTLVWRCAHDPAHPDLPA